MRNQQSERTTRPCDAPDHIPPKPPTLWNEQICKSKVDRNTISNQEFLCSSSSTESIRNTGERNESDSHPQQTASLDQSKVSHTQQNDGLDSSSNQPTPTTVLNKEIQRVTCHDKVLKAKGHETLTVMSANANSLKNKLTSLKFNIAQLHPHIIVVQETKIKRKSQIELSGYQTYPTIRGDSGGGIMIACLSSLDPVLIFEGDAESEVLVVQVTLKSKPLRVIAGYGPQESSPVVVRETYRNTVEEQVERAYLAGCMVLIAEDANAKLGPELLSNDPHPISENGKLLAAMIKRQNLCIINNSDKCQGGPITRRRKLKNRVDPEESCIDFIITSTDLENELESALIDSNQLYTLTKFTTTKGIPSIKKSDHYTLAANFSVKWTEKKQERVEFFKLRDAVGLSKFHKVTSKCQALIQCVQPNVPLEEACSNWYKGIRKLLFVCFKKIRITDKPPKNSIDYPIYQLMETNKILKKLALTAAQICRPILKAEVRHNEAKIAVIQGKKCQDLIKDVTADIYTEGKFNQNAAWKLKKKLFPKSSDAPFAVYDSNKHLVTTSADILTVMKEEFAHRLRNREMSPEYNELREIKEYLCALRLEITKQSSYDPWTIDELRIAIGKLKNNKCRDPHGHINELYKEMGVDGLTSLLTLLNRIKDELLIPNKLKMSNVSTIYKGKGSKKDVVNLRGIFKLPVIRNILDKLIYIQDSDVINQNMGQFQVGNQKERGIRDHTFVAHAIINEAQVKGLQLDIQFTDIKQCFDSIWLEDAINDLYLSGVCSRNLNLLYEGNSSTEMLVETRFGQSERVTLKRIVMQGSVSGGSICSNQISKLCNKSYNEGCVYMYSEVIPIPSLAMVDDIISVALCNSVDGIQKNVKTDEFVKSKKLESQVGDGKCQWIHIGGEKCNSVYKANNQELTQCEVYKYLGDHVSDGWEPLYKKRQDKAVGYSITCQAMSVELCLGYQLFSTAKLLHQSIFLNGTLLNMETWPHFTEKRVIDFERIEQGLLRKILSAHSKTPIESLYLELGVPPFRFHLSARRVMFYHAVLHRNCEEITRKVMMQQKKTMYKGDVYQLVLQDLDLLGISENDLNSMNKLKLKDTLKKRVPEVAFQYLINLAQTHSKVNHGIYRNLDGMQYFQDHRISAEQAKLLFRFRTRMVNVRNNFRNHYKCSSCPLCGIHQDTQEHLFDCIMIKKHYQLTTEYSDIFSSDCDCLRDVAVNLERIIDIRNKLLEEIVP